MNKVYSGMDTLPIGRADDSITEGCIVLEGGGKLPDHTGAEGVFKVLKGKKGIS